MNSSTSSDERGVAGQRMTGAARCAGAFAESHAPRPLRTAPRTPGPSITTLVLLALCLAPVAAHASDQPLEGRRLRMRAVVGNPTKGRLRVVMKDAALAAPFADPTSGSRLTIAGGAADGQCFVDLELDDGAWQPRRNDGSSKGWRYRAPRGAPGGVRSIAITRGRIRIAATGAEWPCDLEAAQRLPVSVRLVGGADRYCASFGGEVLTNESGAFLARTSPAPAACVESDDVTIANLNILHGLFCMPDNCRFPDRVALFYQWLVDAGCPDVVTLQEILASTVGEFDAGAAGACPFAYEKAHLLSNTADDVLVLSRYPIVHSEVLTLYKNFRNVAHVRIDHPIGALDVVSTHLAAGVDGGGNPCDVDCPAECSAAGASTVRECQAVQAVEFAASRHDLSTPAFLTGDFNAEPGEFEYLQATARGWLDTHLAAGNPECNLATGEGCGGNRDDLADLESPAILVDERIDYIFLIEPSVGACSLDSPIDDDGDGTATGIWANLPNPFAPSCGPLPDPICWPSDHNGNQADLDCAPTP